MWRAWICGGRRRAALVAAGLMMSLNMVGNVEGGAGAQTPEMGTTVEGKVGADAQVKFELERPGLPVPRFTMMVRRDGTGTYKAEEVGSPSGGGSAETVASQQVERGMTLNAGIVERIFAAARELHGFNVLCASKAKNIADTGRKTLSYTGAGSAGACTYNFSENKTVAMLTDLFEGIAFTMDEGRRLEFEHRFDRLGLDAEMEMLTHAVEEKRALDVGTIAPVLSSIVSDTEVMQRVRQRAARLLELAEQGW